MRYIYQLGRILRKAFVPIKRNGAFFCFMYLLGCVCQWAVIPDKPGAKMYEWGYLELFFDLYIVCLLLMLIPRKVRVWVRGVLYVLLYVLALVDVYCWITYNSVLTPTMLMLVGETNVREASEMIGAFLSPDVIFSKVGWVLLVLLLHVLMTVLPSFEKRLSDENRTKLLLWKGHWGAFIQRATPWFGLLIVVMMLYAAVNVAENKQRTYRLLSKTTIGEVEHELTKHDKAVLYVPVYRFLFSAYANSLTAKQIDKLIKAADQVVVDSCSYRSPDIVFIIGESFGRHHSQQYGYFMPTTPRQVEREKSGLLVKFSDVVAPWNLTSFVFKYLFSMYVVGQEGEWCDYPLFPELFRKAGYHVTFLTNQFLPKAGEAVYDFSGGFFLNNPTLSKAQFDTRNTRTFPFDAGLLEEYDSLSVDSNSHLFPPTSNLTIFHLLGQHVTYRTRYPARQRHFTRDDYDESRPELTRKQRRILSEYDNATLYNDSIVDEIIKRFEDKDAIVIYMPDHGEECYEGKRGIMCRNHAAVIDRDLARYEFEIPFWIYCSRKYIQNHPDVYQQIIEAKDRRLMTDAIPHLLLYLAGIHAKDYHEEYNILSPKYDETRPRILKGVTDYDQLRIEELKK